MGNAARENALSVLKERLGQASEPTDWFEITQDRVNGFADATLDQQWIHVDPERAKDGPFGKPIAHGQLTLSIRSFLPGGQDVGSRSGRYEIGYQLWLNKVRFMNPVGVGSKIRIRVSLLVQKRKEMLEVINEMTVEIRQDTSMRCRERGSPGVLVWISAFVLLLILMT